VFENSARDLVSEELFNFGIRFGFAHQGLYNYSILLRKLITHVGEDLGRLGAHWLRQFVLARC
jgi:hypothetical protein